MLIRVEIGPENVQDDAKGRMLAKRIKSFLGIPLAECRTVSVYTIDGLNMDQAKSIIELGIWHDPVFQRAEIGKLDCQTPCPAFIAEISLKAGVTDNEGRVAEETAAIALNAKAFKVHAAQQYRFVPEKGQTLQISQIEKICKDMLCNGLIQRFRIASLEEWTNSGGFKPLAYEAKTGADTSAKPYPLDAMTDEELTALSRRNTWALNLKEMQTIKKHFMNEEVRKMRQKKGLPDSPTDAEMETLAQTWSEHCKHKIFSAKIDYFNGNAGKKEQINSLYKTCIKDATAIIRKRRGINDYCLSVFNDNAGVIAFIDGYDACIKVETHNSPSALDPYGGALTGIVGVNRDPLGTGMGADLVCNMDVFCFAEPDYKKPLPERILHPARILEGVRKGIEDGGNQSGIPTVNGSLVFDNRYLGKPLVFCGTVGLLPEEICGRPGYMKKAKPGDLIVMAGGRIGKDGIHGATFSSEELHMESPSTAVQIGDPITQRKLYDFILKAREACLYNSITDNGAGGLSSSVGEMAEDTGGCLMDLSLAPLKYAGLAPWEILLSEAQERMTFAVPKEKADEFLKLAKHMDVEAAVLGSFTDSGYFEIFYGKKPVALLDLDFLHHGVPQLELKAMWTAPEYAEADTSGICQSPEWHNEFINVMLQRFNICSKESIIRQYDHEVRGGSAIKPLAGVLRDGPSDAAVFRPLVESDSGLVLAHGICPKFSDYDTYWMAANAIDEAIRNAVAVGANPDFLAGVDNFCWCDPVESPGNPDGRHKLGQLVRACQSLRQFCLAYAVPCISGKDSMKNDYLGKDGRISIPPTLLFTVLGVIDNVTKTQTADFKNPGDVIYLLGDTLKELGASEAYSQLGIKGGEIPRVDAASAIMRYRAIHALMGQKAISACHDCSDGGLAVALAEMCIGGRLGCEINLDMAKQGGGLNAFELLYSESASRHIVTVKPDLASLLDALGMWQICRPIGKVIKNPVMTVQTGDTTVLKADVETLAASFKKTFA